MLNLSARLKQNKMILGTAKVTDEKLKIKPSAVLYRKRSKVCGSEGVLKT